MLRSDLLSALLGLAVCGCSSQTPTPTSRAPVEPAPSSLPSSTPVAPSASAVASSSASSRAPSKPPSFFATPASAAGSFSIQCVGPASAGNPPRACIFRGRIRAIKQLDTLPDASWLQDGFAPAVPNRTVDVDVAPDDGVPCPTPLDATAKEMRLPEADYPDLARAGRVRILGGERIASELAVGKRVCGWARFIARPGVGYPSGWEGELMGGDAKDRAWKLLGAYSLYLSPTTNEHLSRAWGFSREGAARRIPLEGGGAFIFHDAIRIQHNGQNATSEGGAEVLLKGSDGTFAVQATSDLTAGNVPTNVGRHDGFFFAAVRAEP